jgi:hypothetical protein
VPFSADSERRIGGKDVVVDGRFWRASDGSTRTESWVRGINDVIIVIKNVTTNRYFEKLGNARAWCSHPMALPSRGYLPLKRRTSMPGLSAVATPVEGFEVFRYSGGTPRSTTTELQSPALNFFALVVQDFTGTHLRHFNIRLGEQEPALFMPPPDATVEEHVDPRGIVSGESGTQLKPGMPHKPK